MPPSVSGVFKSVQPGLLRAHSLIARMIESNKEEERLARVEHTIEQIRKLQRDADAFKHHVTVEVVVRLQSGLTPSAMRALRAEWQSVQDRVRRARARERHQ